MSNPSAKSISRTHTAVYRPVRCFMPDFSEGKPKDYIENTLKIVCCIVYIFYL